MIGIYLLVTIFSQFAPVTQLVNDWATGSLPTPAAPVVMADETVSIYVNFDKINDLRVGSPVIVDGKQVGEVSEITSPENSAENQFSVALQVKGSSSSIGAESIALQAAPMSVSRTKAETVVELVSFPGQKGRKLQGGEKLAGFSSIEKFWTGASSKRRA